MPLPFAPPAKDSSLYEDLKSKTLQTLTAAELDTIKGKSFVQGVDGSEDEMRRLLLAGLASSQLSVAGPMPDTQFVMDKTGITNSNNTVYKPEVNTVWQLVAASIITLDGAASMILNIINDDGDKVQIDTFNGTSNPMELNEPIFISNNAWLSVRTSDASGGNARLGVSLIRVR